MFRRPKPSKNEVVVPKEEEDSCTTNGAGLALLQLIYQLTEEFLEPIPGITEEAKKSKNLFCHASVNTLKHVR